MKGYIQGLKRRQQLFSVVLLIVSIFLVTGSVYAFKNNRGRYAAGALAKPKPSNEKVKVVVIDPGHGGHDTGCLGSSSREKDVALAISLKLGKMIEDNFKDVKVVYTRKTDVFVELYRRAQIANENNADLFICIHCNSGPKAAYGVETYVMGLHKTEGNLSVAKRENESVLMESNYKTNYDGYDPNSPEADIIFSLYQSAYLERSLSFAAKVQNQARTYAKRYDRKVRQAGFLVLWKTAMPSVLIETGFLTNGEEHDFLSSGKGKDLMATSIYRAFIDYKSEVEGIKYVDNLKTDTTSSYKAPVKVEVTTVAEEEEEDDDPTDGIEVEKPVVVKEDPKPVIKEEPKVEVKNDPKPIVKEEPKTEVKNTESAIVYRVQFFSSPSKIGVSSTKFKGLADVFEYKSGDNYRYTAGKYSKFAEAVKYQATVRGKGYKDAFVVVFKDGKRLMGDDAKRYLR